MTSFGKLAKQARIELGISQAVVAAETGIASALVSQYESGKLMPALPNALKLSKYLGFSLDDLRETVSIPCDIHLVRVRVK